MPRCASAKHKHKHHKKHHHKPAPFCPGKNFCDDDQALCDPNGLCGCYVTVGSGEHFCVGSYMRADCSECTAAETCIDLSGGDCSVGADVLTGCAVPCPNPL
jgi:hypothetical protein